MPQILNLSRLLFPSPLLFRTNSKLSSPLSHFFNSKIPFSGQRLLLTVCSSYSKQKRSRDSGTNLPFGGVRRRNNSSLIGTDDKNIITMNKRKKSGLDMEVEEVSASINSTHGFNKKRAQGRDQNDRPKDLATRKTKKPNATSTISYVQILGTGMDTHDTSPSVLLFFDNRRFIFNAGEGLQRFCTEHKIKLSKIDHIFLSRVCSETAGGLPGLLLTLAGIGENGMSVNMWGPSDLQYLVNAMKSFIPNAAMVHTHCFGLASESSVVTTGNSIVLIDDEVVKLSAILLRPSTSAVTDLRKEKADHMTSGSDNIPQDLDLKVEAVQNPGNLAVIYICELPEIAGVFHPEKAAALGLIPGPKYQRLKLGESVMSDKQNIMVHPSDVLGPPDPGPIVLLVDCPTLCHLKELISLQSLNSYYTDTSGKSPHGSKIVNCVIHLSPSHVVSTSNYQEWMSRFNTAQHILAGHEMKNVEVPILKSSARIAARLNYICPQFFPATGFQCSQELNQLPSESSPTSEDASSDRCESIPAENLLKFHLRPYAQLGLDERAIPEKSSKTQIVNDLISEIPEITEACHQVRQFWHGVGDAENPLNQVNKTVTEEPWLQEGALPSCLEDVARDDMEIVLLGTGSSQPSKYRNVSAIFINIFSKGGILFDCGEGTLGQLKRRFGIDGADEAIKSLRCIWISHIHADHHTGLARILALRRELMKGASHEPLIVIGPWQLKRFLDAYQRLEDLDMQFLDCKYTTEAFWESFRTAEEDDSTVTTNSKGVEKNAEQNIKGLTQLFSQEGSRMQSYWKSPADNAIVFPILKRLTKSLKDGGLETIISVPVVHCPQAFGVVLKAAERINGTGKTIPGWKLVYSGDTRPCPELVKASRDATVLIHEATFEDGMIEEAVSRNHSTTGEAIEVGESAGAYRIILTHFSQRYPKIPVFDEAHMDKTCIAFDLMSINLADLPLLPNVLPYLKLLFKDEMMLVDDESGDNGINAPAITEVAI